MSARPTTENELKQRGRSVQDNLALIRRYFDLDTVKRLTRFAAPAGRPNS
jgi:hypothetical protein